MLNSKLFTSLYFYEKVNNNIKYIHNKTTIHKKRDYFNIPNLYYRNPYYSLHFSIYVIESIKYDLYSILMNFNIFSYVFMFLKLLKIKNNFIYYSNYLGKYKCEFLSNLNLFVHGENVRRKANLSISSGFVNIYNHFSFNLYNRFSKMYNLDGDNLRDLFVKRKILYQIKSDFGEEKNQNIKQYFDLLLNLLQVLQDKYMKDFDLLKYKEYFEKDELNTADLVISSTLFYNTGNILTYIDLKLNKRTPTNGRQRDDILFLSFVLTPQRDFYCYRDIEKSSIKGDMYNIEDEDVKRIKRDILQSSLFIKKKYKKIIFK